MYKRMLDDGTRRRPSGRDEIVLEDTEEGETVLGEGLVANQRPPSGGPMLNKRPISGRPNRAGGPPSSNLNERELQKLKRQLQKNQVPHDNTNDAITEPSKSQTTISTDQIKPIHSALFNDPVVATKLQLDKSTVDVDTVRHKVETSDESPVKISKEVSRKESPKPEEKKIKTRAELLSMLDMADPERTVSPNRSEQRMNQKPSVHKKDSCDDIIDRLDDFELCDIDESELLEAQIVPPVKAKLSAITNYNSYPIDLQTAKNLKSIIFGTTLQQFYEEWRFQSLSFSDRRWLKYGIIQTKGGPCGVLAAIQACVLQVLLFDAIDAGSEPMKRLNPSRSERTEGLAAALAVIFWRAGSYRSASVALPSGKAYFTGSSEYKADGLTEMLLLTVFEDYKDLSKFLLANISHFETAGSSGVVLALYSAILSRSVDGIREDMDDPGGNLMGQHFYCTQDMVNLLLTGRAHSNVFNDVIELGSGKESIILKGLTKRNDIGFLTLFEHYKSCLVGTYYKTPKYPIWVICCESHFSVLFSTRRDLISDWKAERRFDLFYFDGLANQSEEIRFTIDTTKPNLVPSADDEDLMPPLENCIRTKWPGAIIDWNGTEPLL